MLLLLGLVVTATWLGAAPAGAQERSTPGVDDATVFPVVGSEGNGSAAGIEWFGAVAGAPDRGRAVVPATGRQDALLYGNRTFRTYGFGTFHRYADAAWRPDGLIALAGDAPRQGIYRLWLFSPSGLQPAVTSNSSIGTVGVGPSGRTLIGGTDTDGDTGFLLDLGVNGTRRAKLATEFPVLDVAWHPSGDRAAVAGLHAGLFLYRNGTMTPVDGAGNATLAAVDWRPDGEGLVAVGAEDRNGSRPVGPGVVLTGDADGVTATRGLEGPVYDVAWRPDGSYALAVGGTEASPRLHGVRPAGSVRSRPLGGVAGAVDWYGDDDALLVGGARIWRYSHGTTAAELPPTASVTVTPPRPTAGSPFRIVGFGSTANGSADRIEAYRFAVGENVTDWRGSPAVTARFDRAGRYDVGVRARAGDGRTSPWRNATVVVEDSGRGIDRGGSTGRPDGAGETEGSSASPIWLLMGLTGAVLLAVVTVSALRRRG